MGYLATLLLVATQAAVAPQKEDRSLTMASETPIPIRAPGFLEFREDWLPGFNVMPGCNEETYGLEGVLQALVRPGSDEKEKGVPARLEEAKLVAWCIKVGDNTEGFPEVRTEAIVYFEMGGQGGRDAYVAFLERGHGAPLPRGKSGRDWRPGPMFTKTESHRKSVVPVSSERDWDRIVPFLRSTNFGRNEMEDYLKCVELRVFESRSKKLLKAISSGIPDAEREARRRMTDPFLRALSSESGRPRWCPHGSQWLREAMRESREQE